MPGPATTPSDMPAPRAALVALAAALDPRDYAVTLTTRPGHQPCLSVTSRHAAIGDDITADHRAYHGPGASASAPSATQPPLPSRSAPCYARCPSLPMGDPGQRPCPGPDEIVLSAPAAGELCSSLEHHRVGRPAQVVVTLGQMGTADRHREALWMEAWGRSYPMCAPCWDATRQVAQARRPNLVITGTTCAPAG